MNILIYSIAGLSVVGIFYLIISDYLIYKRISDRKKLRDKRMGYRK